MKDLTLGELSDIIIAAQKLAPVVHGDLEISRGKTLSEEHVERLLIRLKKGNKVPQYVKNCSEWPRIRDFIGASLDK